MKWSIFPDGDHFEIVAVPPEVEALAQKPYFSAIFRVFFDNKEDAYRMAEDIERYVGAQWIRMLNRMASESTIDTMDRETFARRHNDLLADGHIVAARRLKAAFEDAQRRRGEGL